MVVIVLKAVRMPDLCSTRRIRSLVPGIVIVVIGSSVVSVSSTCCLRCMLFNALLTNLAG